MPLPKYLERTNQLTIIAIATEERVKPDEVGPAAKGSTLADEHLLDQPEATNDHALGRAQLHLIDVPVLLSHLGEGLKRSSGVGQQVHVANHRECQWSLKVLPGREAG